MKEWSEQYPDMKDYAEERIHAAQAIRAKLKDEIIPCRLTYSVVEIQKGWMTRNCTQAVNKGLSIS